MNDHKILKLFKNGQREKAFIKLYTLYPRIEKLVLSKGGSKEDANDVFQEALIILYRNLMNSDFKLSSSFYTYLYSVSRFVWSDKQRKLSKEQFQNFNADEVETFQSVIEESKFKQAEKAFLQIGNRCQQLLRAFYQQKLSFREIARTMNFSSENSAKNQKYKCLKKVQEIYRKQFEAV